MDGIKILMQVENQLLFAEFPGNYTRPPAHAYEDMTVGYGDFLIPNGFIYHNENKIKQSVVTYLKQIALGPEKYTTLVGDIDLIIGREVTFVTLHPKKDKENELIQLLIINSMVKHSLYKNVRMVKRKLTKMPPKKKVEIPRVPEYLSRVGELGKPGGLPPIEDHYWTEQASPGST